MLDMEHIEYLVREIKRNINCPYPMANEELVNDFFPEIQKKIPQVQVFKIDIRQWFVVTEKANKKLVLQLSSEMEEHRKKASELSKLIDRIK